MFGYVSSSIILRIVESFNAFLVNSGRYMQLYFHRTFVKQIVFIIYPKLLSLGPKPNQKVLDSRKYCAEVMLLCAPLSLKKALRQIYPRDLFYSVCVFLFQHSHTLFTIKHPLKHQGASLQLWRKAASHVGVKTMQRAWALSRTNLCMCFPD